MLSLFQIAATAPEAQDFLLQLYQSHERLMYAIVKNCVKDPYIREDVVQESILKLAQKVDLLRTLDKPALSAYVSVATRNTAYSYLRKRSMEDTILLPWTLDTQDIPTREPSMDETLVLKEEIQYFMRVWKFLPEEDRFLLEGKYILQYNDQDLAKTLGCKPGSIRMKLTRLRRKVLKHIQALERGEEPI